jgi:hypothetical protein
MLPPFDIFRVSSTGALRWLEAAPTVDDAKKRIQEMTTSSSDEYIIYSQQTGNKVLIKAGDVSSEQPSTQAR